MHGQWDWMRDPKIHSTTWEWDHACAAEGWKKSHNFEHHTYTNVLGKDRDLGYSIMRVSAEQKWQPVHLLQPVYNQALAMFFEWGVAFYDLEVDLVRDGKKSKKAFKRDLKRLWRKARRQLAKDYVLFPALSAVSGPQSVVASMAASFVANLVRNFWSHAVIFCGHFPEGVETFPEERLEGETRGQWYVRQMMGSANLSGRPAVPHHDRQPQPPDRAPHLPGHPEQPVRRDRAAGAGDLRPLRPALHHRPAAQAVRQRAPQDQPLRLPRRAERAAAEARTAASLAVLPVRPDTREPVRLAG